MSLSNLCANVGVLNAVISPGFCAGYIPLDFGKARTIVSITKDSFLTLEQNTNTIVYASKINSNVDDSNSDNWSVKTIVTEDGLNHGLALWDNYIYASSDSDVYRWSYADTMNFTSTTASIGPREHIITNMNDDGQGGQPGGHSTRTLVFDMEGRLYVSVGSNENVDNDSFRSRIRRFTVQPPYPINFVTGEVFADGVRNEVGLAFDSLNVLWGVENGPDELVRLDLGLDIVQDNPAEELNRFPESDAGAHYGYPYCFTEYDLPQGLGRGTVWAWPTFKRNGLVSDEQCRMEYKPPALAMQGHSAPLGITFYKWKESNEKPQYCSDIIPFPKEMDGFAFIAFHGSWNRDIPTGYKVVYVPIQQDNTTEANVTATGPIDLLAHEPPNAQWENGFRPVDVDFDECGRLLVSSDNTGLKTRKVVRIDRIETTTFEIPPSVSPTLQPTQQSAPLFSEVCGADDIVQCTDDTSGDVGVSIRRKILFFPCRQRCETRVEPPLFLLRLLRWECGVC